MSGDVLCCRSSFVRFYPTNLERKFRKKKKTSYIREEIVRVGRVDMPVPNTVGAYVGALRATWRKLREKKENHKVYQNTILK